MRIPLAIHLLLLSFLGCRVASGQQTSPTQGDTSGGPRYNLERYLFSNPASERLQRAHLDRRLEELAVARPHSLESATKLLHTLVLMDSVSAEAKRHSTYLYLRTMTNTLDRASEEARSAIDARATGAASAVRTTVGRIDPKVLDKFIAERPALETYRFVVNSARRYSSHTPGPSQAETVSRLAPLATDWPLALYDQAMARINFGSVQTADRPLDVYRQRGAIASSPDSAVRNAGHRLYWAGFNSQRDLFAMAMIGNVKARNALARERNFADAPAESYYRAYLTPDDVKALIARVRAQTQLSKRYQSLLARRAQWVAVQPRNAAGVRRLPISIDSASRLIEIAMAPLGSAYHKELARLLDSTNGRLDIGPGQHRASGGASFGAGVVQSGVFLSSFEGLPADVSRLAHEAGHAVENQFHFVDGVSPAYTNGTSNAVGSDFLSEAYAKFNELMLADQQIRSAKTDSEKQLYLTQFLSSALPFSGAQGADLEQAIYDGVATERVGNADQLDSLTREVDLAYDVPNDARREVKARWITRRLMIEDPVYHFNYLYSGILALKLFERYTADPVHFAPRYVGLVRAGYRASPRDAVKQALDIDLADSKLLDDAITLVRARVDELDALFARQEGRSLSPR